MSALIRNATRHDLPAIADLIQDKRVQYEPYQPTFWRIAPQAVEKHLPFLETMLTDPRTIALVSEEGTMVQGFVIARIVDAPAVYDPGGPTCVIDDFWVRDGSDWDSIGPALLNEASRRAQSEFKASQVLVVCGHQDLTKRAMLKGQAFTIASEWYVRPLSP